MLKLRKISIKRYKSIRNVTLNLGDDLSLLIGSNGTGKSSILQSLSFAQFFAAGSPEAFFSERAWQVSDVLHRNLGSKATVFGMDIYLERASGDGVFWSFTWGAKTRKSQRETVWRIRNGSPESEIFSFSVKGGLRFNGEAVERFPIKPSGSILSIIEFSDDSDDSDASDLAQLKAWAQGIMSLELVQPSALRRRARVSVTDIGPRGELFSGFLASLDSERKARISARLDQFYATDGVSTKKRKAGWVEYKVRDRVAGLDVDSDHVSDGVLRLLAFCTLPEISESKSVILVDEIEDGIEPHLLPRLIDILKEDAGCQVIATSHSPVVVNQVDQSNVYIVSRDEGGCAQAIKLSDMNLFSKNEEHFGAGEVWLAASLSSLHKQIAKARVGATDASSSDMSSDRPSQNYVARFLEDLSQKPE